MQSNPNYFDGDTESRWSPQSWSHPVVQVPISALIQSDSPRISGPDLHHVQALAESLTDLPPIVVHRATMRVVDGAHRVRAVMMHGAKDIGAIYIDGDDADAFVLAVQLNARCGLPLSQADRASAAARILSSHPQWSDRVIASVTGLAAKTVASIRQRATVEGGQLNIRVGRDGRVRPVSSAEGRRLAARLIAEMPDASLRVIAQTSGIAIGTVRDVRERLRRGEDAVPAQQREAERRQLDQRSRLPSARNSGVVSAPASAVNVRTNLQNLRQDPSLRLNETGRTVLRLMDLHLIDARAWDQFLANIPTHLAEMIAEIADECARTWTTFSRRLREQQRADRVSA